MKQEQCSLTVEEISKAVLLRAGSKVSLEGLVFRAHALEVRGGAVDLGSGLLKARLGALGHGVNERREGRGGNGARSRRGGGVGCVGEGGDREGRGCGENEHVTEGHCEYETASNVVQRNVLVGIRKIVSEEEAGLEE